MADKLDITKTQDVKYAIELWLRDEQIKLNTARVPGRVKPIFESRADPIAIVGYGPSLNQTWEQLKDFKYIMTCSGAHRFLIDRGIIPTWHVDVDPRAHKIKLIGEPHKDVEYLLSSTCHPTYFKMLLDGGFNVKLWHVFENKEEFMRVLPANEWALFGGSDAGHRAMVIATFMGFRNLHMFGIDGSAGGSGSHAADHPLQRSKYAEVEFEGRTFLTTAAMLECVRQLPHEVDQLGSDVTVKFHGDGLAQAYMRNYVPDLKRVKGQPSCGIVKAELISEEYRTLNTRLHEDNLAYGVGGGKHAETVLKLVASLAKELNTGIPVSVLDYGCGKGYLQKALPFPIYEYDPAVPGKTESPRPADLVICSDVLEHIEPDKLDAVLDDLRRCVKHQGYFIIHTGPAGKSLADGRNAHLIQQGRLWWKTQLRKYFKVPPEAVTEDGMLLHVLVSPKPGFRLPPGVGLG